MTGPIQQRLLWSPLLFLLIIILICTLSTPSFADCHCTCCPSPSNCTLPYNLTLVTYDGGCSSEVCTAYFPNTCPSSGVIVAQSINSSSDDFPVRSLFGLFFFVAGLALLCLWWYRTRRRKFEEHLHYGMNIEAPSGNLSDGRAYNGLGSSRPPRSGQSFEFQEYHSDLPKYEKYDDPPMYIPPESENQLNSTVITVERAENEDEEQEHHNSVTQPSTSPSALPSFIKKDDDLEELNVPVAIHPKPDQLDEESSTTQRYQGVEGLAPSSRSSSEAGPSSFIYPSPSLTHSRSNSTARSLSRNGNDNPISQHEPSIDSTDYKKTSSSRTS